ncbi:MAG TPA: hypothetical protein VL652_02345 [Kutzneria sp.]|jgi:hypothetical protein|nr:hypothetical protein [Kutzneria sp.]
MGPRIPPSPVVVVVLGGVVVVGRVGFGGLVVFVGRLVVVDVVVVVVVVVVEAEVVDDVVRGGRLLVWVTGTGTTGSGPAVLVRAGACCPWKSAVIGCGIFTNAMPSTTPATADTTSAVLALITRSNGVLAARSTLGALSMMSSSALGTQPTTQRFSPIGNRFQG